MIHNTAICTLLDSLGIVKNVNLMSVKNALNHKTHHFTSIRFTKLTRMMCMPSSMEGGDVITVVLFIIIHWIISHGIAQNVNTTCVKIA